MTFFEILLKVNLLLLNCLVKHTWIVQVEVCCKLKFILLLSIQMPWLPNMSFSNLPQILQRKFRFNFLCSELTHKFITIVHQVTMLARWSVVILLQQNTMHFNR